MIKRTNLRLMVAAIMVVLIGAGSAWADLTDGLVAHWKLDGDANDSAGSNDGTLMGDPQWVTGKIGSYALDFDGDDYVEINDDPSLDFAAGEDFSVSAWFKTSSSSPQRILQKYTAGEQRGYALMSNSTSTGLLSFKTWYGGVEIAASHNAGYNDGQWHHIAGVRNQSAGKMHLYVDGIEVNNADETSRSLENSAYLYIGVDFTGDRNYFGGTIDEVMIYDRALSAGEVHQLYGGELLGLEITGPNEVAEDSQVQYKAIAHYDNDTAVDVTDLADWSVEPNDNCGIIVGLLTTEPIDLPEDITIYAEYTEDGNSVAAEKEVEVFAVCPSGSALEFDGVNDYVEIADDDSLTPQSKITIAFWVYNRGGQSAGIF